MNPHKAIPNVLSSARQLSDRQLVEQVERLARSERQATAALIGHLAVFDKRGLYRNEGYSSTFSYCVEVLHLSEHATYGRIAAARAARKYPIILELLADGSVNLTTITLLAPHLTRDNHVEVLEAARHLRRREVEELIARRRPQPPVPSSIRKLPTPHAASAPQLSAQDGQDESPNLNSIENAPTLILETPVRPAIVTPLAPERYKVEFTASAEMQQKLRVAQELLRHQIPDGDIAKVFDRALTALLKDLKKQKFAATDQPRNISEDSRPTDSRRIPAEVKRQVWTRDDGRCAFVAKNGHRCAERGFLEFHHVKPCSVGGEATIDNIQLRCRAHNEFEAETFFGRRAVIQRPSTRFEPSSSGTGIKIPDCHNERPPTRLT